MAPKVVTPEQWLEARLALLAKEKELTRLNDELALLRQQMPREPADAYSFDEDGREVTLADLFGPHSQLIIYHFMFAPDWEQGCKSCPLVADHFNPAVVHLAARDIAFCAASKAPWEKLTAFRDRMGWAFRWVSSGGNRFNKDYNVSFTQEEIDSGTAYYNYKDKGFPSREAPGFSVFAKDGEGAVHHSYSVYERGLDRFMTAYQLMDLVPKGRDEAALSFGMEWLHLRDSY
jgi:predicted dithiol-disulfide oxidoreductase (DUF899 family)